MTEESLGFVHRFVPAQTPDALTLLLLHGTGGDENDLLPVGRMLDERAALLSPRGKVLEHGMPRFFRRLAEGVFDQEDLVERSQELAEFVKRAVDEDPDHLGENLKLPPWLEKNREHIEEILPPVHLPERRG